MSDANQNNTVGFIEFVRNINSDNLAFGYATGVSRPYPLATNYFQNLNNQWVHIVVICDYTNKTLKFYRSGVQFGATQNLTTPVFPSTNRVKYIGAYSGGEYNLTDGSLDDVKIYNRGLSAQEISSIYNQTKHKYQ